MQNEKQRKMTRSVKKKEKSKRKNSGDVNCGSSIAKCILTPKSKRKQTAKNRLIDVRDSNRVRAQQLDKRKITCRKSTASVQSIAFFRQSISQYANNLDNGIELDARRQLIPSMRHPVFIRNDGPKVMTPLKSNIKVENQLPAPTRALKPASRAQNPFGSTLRSSLSKSVLSRWSFSLPRSRPSQKSITWYSVDDQTPSTSQISSTTSRASQSPVYRTPFSSSETLHTHSKFQYILLWTNFSVDYTNLIYLRNRL